MFKQRLHTRFTLAIACCALLIPASARADVMNPPGCLTGPLPETVCPLKHTSVTADVTGFFARVTVIQHFENPSNVPIEAVYTFPLPADAAVDRMEMKIGDRHIHGDVKKREEARQMYEAAKAAGQAAGLLDQERPNIFTQSVANIMPGDEIQIQISYVHTLPHENGEYTFSFPMVVGPRYNPAGVTDASKISPPVTPPGTRAGHDISLRVNLDAGVPIQGIDSELHPVTVKRKGDNRAKIQLAAKKEIPNRDFIMRYNVRGDEVSDAIFSHKDDRGGFFTLMLQPPDRVKPKQITPKELMFVIDCSGSMSGFPIEKAKATMRQCIEQMNPNDTFNLVTFAGGVGYCFDGPVKNNKKNREYALGYLSRLQGSGGTEMMKAIRAALENQNDPERLRVVCFMTDGYIGNEVQILDAIQRNAGTARVFSFGIGNSVNTFLIESMAREGRGQSEIVTLSADGDAAANRFAEAVQSPVLTDITVEFEGAKVYDVFPAQIPDLFAAGPVVIHGRYRGKLKGNAVIRGNTVDGKYARRVALNRITEDNEASADALASVWARQKIAAVMATDWLAQRKGSPLNDTQQVITDIGLEYDLVTPYTSFIAVEEKIVNESGVSRTIQVPVELPDGVSYEGIFGDAAASEVAAARGASAQSLGRRPLAQKMSANHAPLPAAPPADRLSEPRREVVARPDVASGPAPQMNLPAEQEVDRAQALSDDRDEAKEKALQSKIAPELRNLAQLLELGKVAPQDVRVVDGWVEVFIVVKSDDAVDALRKLGVDVKAYTASGKRVYARLRVDAIEKIAGMDSVKSIGPAKF